MTEVFRGKPDREAYEVSQRNQGNAPDIFISNRKRENKEEVNEEEEDDIIGILNRKKEEGFQNFLSPQTNIRSKSAEREFRSRNGPNILISNPTDNSEFASEIKRFPLNTLDPRKAGHLGDDEEKLLDFFKVKGPTHYEDLNKMPLTVSQAMSSDGFYRRENRDREERSNLPKVEEDLTLEEIFDQTNKIKNKRRHEESEEAQRLAADDGLRLSKLLMTNKSLNRF